MSKGHLDIFPQGQWDLSEELTTHFHLSFQWLFQPTQGPSLFMQLCNHFYTESRTPWTSDQPVTRPLPNPGQHKHRINTHAKHQSLEWDSNPRFQRPSERTHVMPWTARFLWPAIQLRLLLLLLEWLYSPCGPSPLFSFLIYSFQIGRAPWMSDQLIARSLPKLWKGNAW
jgi:hypothetical protein